MDNFFQILLLSLSYGLTPSHPNQELVMMASKLRGLAIWKDLGLWKKIFKYYCESNAIVAEEENPELKNANSGFFSSMMGFFSKQETKEPQFSEEVLKKSLHDLEHLMIKLEFPFEQLSTVLLKMAKQ